MKILLTGAYGFIGSHLMTALLAAGHQLVGVVRQAAEPPNERHSHPRQRFIEMDFARPPALLAWRAVLADIDVVINTVGILRENRQQSFAALHVAAPRQLFEACVAAGVKYVIQISALGADAAAQSGYHLSKRQADEHLRSLPLDGAIIQPSLVYAPGGASARLFNMLATLPVCLLPGGGGQAIQPVLLDDLVAGIVALGEQRPAGMRTIAFVGSQSLSFRDYLATLRRQLGFAASAWIVPVPLRLVGLIARLGSWLPGSLLDAETLGMLARGNTADRGEFAALLGRLPTAPSAFVAPAAAAGLRNGALLQWAAPTLRWAIALVWIWTGIVSLGLYPPQESDALLARVGVTGGAAALMLYGAAALDLLCGLLSIAAPPARRVWLWPAQLALIAGYSAIITVFLPEFWLHPYGPVLKNLPMMAAILLLWSVDGSAQGPR